MKLLLSRLAVLALSLVAAAEPPRSPPAPPTSAPQTYNNAAIGFRYRIPYGWVERTKEMQEGNAAAGEVLLAIFERPPQAAGDTINAAVVIGAEKSKNYPGLKKAEDYLGPLAELTMAKGFKPEGDASEIEIDLQRMVRADFSRPLNDKLIMHQSTLVLLSKGQIVTFTFIAEGADAVDKLIEGLSFSPPKAKTK